VAANWNSGEMERALSQPAEPNGPNKSPAPELGTKKTVEPGWAKGLRRLYDSVVNEPLPDSFDDLLKKLEKGDDA
jgi:hypothetical protein